MEAKIREQKWRYKEATKWRCATEEGLGDVDLEQEMEAAGDEETTSVTTAPMAMVTTTATVSSSHVVTAEVYSKPYAKTTESRGERSKARSEQKDAKERELMIQRQKEEEGHIAKEREVSEQRKVVEHALLEEEEESQEEILQKLYELEEKKKPRKKRLRR